MTRLSASGLAAKVSGSQTERRARQEASEADAIEEIDVALRKRREQSKKLRALRKASDNDSAERFRQWRVGRKS